MCCFCPNTLKRQSESLSFSDNLCQSTRRTLTKMPLLPVVPDRRDLSENIQKGQFMRKHYTFLKIGSIDCMKKWINIAILFCLAGCAVTPDQSPEVETDVAPQEVLANDVEQNSTIDEEVLYLLMAAELAGQRNQYYLAMDAYLQAAKRVDDPRIAERAVKLGFYLKDDKRTKEALDVWLAKDGKNLGARKFAVLLAIKNADRQAAVENLNALLIDDPAGFQSGLLEMLKVIEKDGRTQFTYDVLEEVNRQQPGQTDVLFLQAILASMLQNKEVAQQKIDEVLQILPDWNKAIIFQAQLAGRNGDLPKARKFLEKAVKQAPEDAQLRKMLLEVLVNAGAIDDAIRVCQNVLDEKPDDGETLFSMALIYIEQNQFEKAESYLEKAYKTPELEGRAAFYLGKIELERKHPDRALAWFDKVVDGQYAFDADLASLSILMNQKRIDEVEKRIKQMESRYPEQKLKILLLKAEFFNRFGKSSEAFDVLTMVLNEAPDNRDILYAQALVAERLGRLDVLEADLQKILQKNPDDVDALNALGYTLTDKTTRYDDAERYLNQALKLQPDMAVIIDSYGWLLYKKGKPEQALDYLRKAYAKEPENEIAAHLVEVLLAVGDFKEAKELFESAYKKSPDDQYLEQFKNRFLSGEQ